MTSRPPKGDCPDITIRPLALGDVEAVAAIDRASYATQWPLDLVLAEIDLDDRCHLVAQLGDAVVGHGSMMYVLDEATLTTIAVEPARRGAGYATRLLAALLRDAIARGMVGATLEVRESNGSARHLYERFGFVGEGRRKRYYEPDGEDAIIMWLRSLQTQECRDRIDALSS